MAMLPQRRTQSRATWRPLYVYNADGQLRTTVRTTYGYRASCEACGWLGKVRRTVIETRADAKYHACGDPPGTEEV